eukprot:13952207-Heterocapsa_arctica.AAC.1
MTLYSNSPLEHITGTGLANARRSQRACCKRCLDELPTHIKDSLAQRTEEETQSDAKRRRQITHDVG